MQYEILVSKIAWADMSDKAEWSADEGLEAKVNAYIQQGWRPQGGVAMSTIKDELIIFSQAMIRD